MLSITNTAYYQNYNKPAFRSNSYGSSKPKKFATGAASLLIPGLGQVINGETSKGIAFFLAGVCCNLLYLRNNKKFFPWRPVDIGIHCYSAYDAYKKA